LPHGSTQRGDVTVEHYAQWLDGLVLHGGADVWPGSYGESRCGPNGTATACATSTTRRWCRRFEAAGKPVFGVCRGLQLLNVAFGGTLYQDINTQVPESFVHRDAVTYDQNFHSVNIVQGSRLSALYPGVERVQVNSIHHQGIKDLRPASRPRPSAPDDGIVEAIRRKDGP
jgi:putative glutamine amidotransferase